MIIALSEIACLAEIIIVVEFLIHFLGWREEIQARRTGIARVLTLLFGMAQLSGRFQYSYQTVILCDIFMLILFCRKYLNGNVQLQILGCTLPFLILTVGNVLIMQILAFFYKIPVKNYLGYYGVYFHIGVLLSKVILAFSLYCIQKIAGKKTLSYIVLPLGI